MREPCRCCSARWHAWQNRAMNAFRRALTAFLLACLLVAAPVAAAPPERVLVFTKTAKFRHDAIPVAVTTLQRMTMFFFTSGLRRSR